MVPENLPQDAHPGSAKPEPARIPPVSSNFYPLTVFCCVLGVAAIGVFVAIVCTGFFREYADLLRSMSHF